MFDIEPSVLFLSIIMSCVALGYISHGKKDNLNFLLAGITLMAVTFLLNTFWALLLVGAACMIFPFIFKF